jgi:membrane-associated protein
MDLAQIIDIFLHLDVHLNEWAGYLGGWLYVVLFLIVFCETGLVVTPFLPGDSLLFAVGALAASPNSSFSLALLFILLTVAAILGDAVNYSIGAWLGPKVFKSESSWLLNKNHLLKTQHFYEKYGGKTIVLARFLPIIRTFAPFVAGIGKMRYSYFAIYNVTGAIAWVSIFLFGGYWLAEQPLVKQNFTYVIIAIIVISVMPPVIEYVMSRRRGAEPKLDPVPLDEVEPQAAHSGK